MATPLPMSHRSTRRRVAALLAQVMAEYATSPVVEIEDEEETGDTGGSGTTTAGAAPSRPVTSMVGVTIHDFYAYMPKHLYIFAPTGEMWPAASVNARLPRIPLKKKNGTPVRRRERQAAIHARPAVWLDKHRAVEQMTWAPGEPQAIVGRLVSDGGWIERPGVATFNLYRPPVVRPGNAGRCGTLDRAGAADLPGQRRRTSSRSARTASSARPRRSITGWF